LLRNLIGNLPRYIFVKDLESQFVVGDLTQDPKGGVQGFLTTRAASQNSQGEVMGTVETNQNITEYQQMDENLCQLGKAVETMRLGVTITDLNGRIIYTNPAEARMHGYAVDDLIGLDLGIFAPAELRTPMTLDQIKEMRHLRESINIKKDGSTFPVRLMSDVVKDAAGEPIAIVTTCEDITDRKRTEEGLKQRTRELALLNRMSELLQACRIEDETYSVVSRICQKLFPSDSGCLCIMEYSEARLKVVNFWGRSPHNFRESAGNVGQASDFGKTHVIEHLDTGSLLCPRLNFCPDNDCLCVPISILGEMLGILSLCCEPAESADSNSKDKHKMEAKRMILTRVAEHYALSLVNLRLRETLRMECIRDPLTDLYNRRYMEESLEREARRAKRHNTPIGIIMLDIDHFKNFNDIYGHEAGDIVLKELGSFLRRHTRGEDIACRYGGEEFLLILPETPLEIVIQRARELHLGVRKLKIVYRGKHLHIKISAGMAVLPDHSPNVKEVVTAADAAMYRAKENGRDQVVIASS